MNALFKYKSVKMTDEYPELKHKVYGIFNKDNQIVYIGRTSGTLEKRFTDHKKSTGCPKISMYLYSNKECYISALSIHKYPDDMICEEKRLIKKYRPIYNISCNNDIPYIENNYMTQRREYIKKMKIDVNKINKYFTSL